jgi:hypothetical protein
MSRALNVKGLNRKKIIKEPGQLRGSGIERINPIVLYPGSKDAPSTGVESVSGGPSWNVND